MSHNLRVPRVLRLLPVAALAVAGSLALAGCTTDPGAAAIVGNSRISDSQLHDAVDAALSNPTFANLVGDQRALLARQELGNLIVLRLLQARATSDGVTVTPVQVQNQIATYAHQAGSVTALDSELAQNGQAPSDLSTSVEENLLLQAIVSKELHTQEPSSAQLNAEALKVIGEETQRLGVHVDPRYGSWTPSRAEILPAVSGLSVSTTRSPSPSAAPPG